MRPLAAMSSAAALLALAIVPTPADANPIEPGSVEAAVSALQQCLWNGSLEPCERLASELQGILCSAAGTCLVCIDFVPSGDTKPDLDREKIVGSSPREDIILFWFGFGFKDAHEAFVPGQYQIRSSTSSEVLCDGL